MNKNLIVTVLNGTDINQVVENLRKIDFIVVRQLDFIGIIHGTYDVEKLEEIRKVEGVHSVEVEQENFASNSNI